MRVTINTLLKEDTEIKFDYINYNKESSSRSAKINFVYFGSNSFHTDPQWILVAFDLEKKEQRHFAMKDMSNVKFLESIGES